MFRLHDTTRRRICLACFLGLCVVPTAIVLAWCAGRHLPGHVETEARKLSRAMGLSVSLESLDHLRPGTVLYGGLELTDPETGQTVLRCRVLEAAWKEIADQEGQARSSLMLIASQPEIEAASLLVKGMRRQPSTPSRRRMRILCAFDVSLGGAAFGRMAVSGWRSKVSTQARPAQRAASSMASVMSLQCPRCSPSKNPAARTTGRPVLRSADGSVRTFIAETAWGPCSRSGETAHRHDPLRQFLARQAEDVIQRERLLQPYLSAARPPELGQVGAAAQGFADIRT